MSESDRIYVESKCAVYQLHEACMCVLTVEQDRCLARVDLRAGDAWEEQLLAKPDELLVLPDFGLRCKVADLYRGTALQPRKV